MIPPVHVLARKLWCAVTLKMSMDAVCCLFWTVGQLPSQESRR